MTHLHFKLDSGLECIYLSETGTEDKTGGQMVRDRCLNSGSMAFGMARVSANPSPLAVRYFDRVGGHGVLGWCSDGMPANFAVTSFGMLFMSFWGEGSSNWAGGRCWDPEACAEGDLSAAEDYRSGLLKGWAVGKICIGFGMMMVIG